MKITNTDAMPSLPDDLNPEIVKATAAFIGQITGLVPPPHDAFPPEWYGYLRTFTARVKEIASENAAPATQADHIADERKMVTGDGHAEAVPMGAKRLIQRHACAARALEHMYTEKNVERLKTIGEELEAALDARSGDDAAQTQATKPKHSPRAAAPSKPKKPEQRGTLAGLVKFLRRKGTLLQMEHMRPPARMNGRVFAKWADELEAVLAEQHEANAGLSQSTEQEEQK